MTQRNQELNAAAIRAAMNLINESQADQFDYGFDVDDINDDGDAQVDRFHAGWDAFQAGAPRPADKDEASGWDYAESAKMSHVVEPERPEGYYHMPIGTFESIEEVREAAEHDYRNNMTSRKGGVYAGRTDLPGHADAKTHPTPARSGDNPLGEGKSFRDYLKETEESANLKEDAKDDLWQAFREKHGPRPGGRGAQARWEAEWEKYKGENGSAK